MQGQLLDLAKHRSTHLSANGKQRKQRDAIITLWIPGKCIALCDMTLICRVASHGLTGGRSEDVNMELSRIAFFPRRKTTCLNTRWKWLGVFFFFSVENIFITAFLFKHMTSALGYRYNFKYFTQNVHSTEALKGHGGGKKYEMGGEIISQCFRVPSQMFCAPPIHF